MAGRLRFKARLRRFNRRHRWVTRALRSIMIFMAAFGGAYGFISGAMSPQAGYDPKSFALGISFLFALACVALATLSMRMRWLKKSIRKLTLHNESLLDRNWELKEAEERARELFESQSDLVVLRAQDGRITFANQTFCTYAGQSDDELLGTAFTLAVLEQGADATESGGTRVHDQQVETSLGVRWISWRENLVRPHANQPAETQCVGRDVTDRVGAERALWNARDYAVHANHKKSKFLAVASHEIRTPLNSMIGMSNLLLDTPLTPEQQSYAKAVKTSGEALAALVEELLDFSKLEAGKIDIAHRPFNLAALIEEITELLAPRAQGRNLEIASYVDERLPLDVVGDAARLRQVILNLAGNAIKFTSSGGVALIVEPGIWPHEVSFLVRDTGIGISPEAQMRIFREFEQGDNPTARDDGSSGLGLSISARIVRRMGGRITLESTIGQGTTFEVSIPLRPSDTAPMSALIVPDLTNQSIMMVARPTIGSSLLARRLARWGAQVCETSEMSVAEALLPERSWHAVLVDHGFGAERAQTLGLFAIPHAAERIALLTPGERRDLQPSAKTGYTGYLVKPVRTTALAARLTGGAPTLAPDLIPDSDAVALIPSASANSLSVLVAEDNEINALLMRSLLDRLGHQCVVCTNGKDAFESWLSASTAGTPYGAVLMDVQMPGLNGIEATQLIRAHEARHSLARTRILALTANALVEDRYTCFEAGMDGFLVKPLDRDKLVEALAPERALHR